MPNDRSNISILGYIENYRLCLEEIYRFDNNIKNENGTLIWDIENLFSEVKAGIAKCKAIGKIPKTVAIDTWGVDYVLLDENKIVIPSDHRILKVRNRASMLICETLSHILGKIDKTFSYIASLND